MGNAADDAAADEDDACNNFAPIVPSAASDRARVESDGVGGAASGGPRTGRRLVAPPPLRVRALLTVVTEPPPTVRWCVDTCMFNPASLACVRMTVDTNT
jgi:hypothetical protein